MDDDDDLAFDFESNLQQQQQQQQQQYQQSVPTSQNVSGRHKLCTTPFARKGTMEPTVELNGHDCAGCREQFLPPIRQHKRARQRK